MSDIQIRITGTAGRITLDRPDAMNALTPAMAAQIETAIDAWVDDEAVRIVVIDATGQRAFCAGGDIASIHDEAKAGNYERTRQFWRDEYRLNAKLATYPKPTVSLMQGFTMGGGVGIGCHLAHRVVGESSKIAMPECGIGLIPDVGGSLLLARGPGRVGEYLALTTARMSAEDAIYVGFADHYVPELKWPQLLAALEDGGDPDVIADYAEPPPETALHGLLPDIDRHFSKPSLAAVMASLADEDSEFARGTRTAVARVSPLSAAVALDLVGRVRDRDGIAAALELEFRATYRLIEEGDFVEGIRAAVIDKDRSPHWRHASAEALPQGAGAAILAPLGANALKLGD